MVGRLIVFVAIALLFFLIGSGLAILVEMAEWFELLDPNIVARRAARYPDFSNVIPIDRTAFGRVTAYFLLAIFFVAFVRALTIDQRLRRFRNLELYKQFLQEQIERLHARWGPAP
jgi:hypothetical protein